jgi:WD40 repeat protein
VIDFWDRFTESQGKKGNWLTDLMGNTRPESKRLREFVKDLGSLPAGCISVSHPASTEDFTRWQTTVRNYKGFGKKESLRHVLLRRTLEPALRDDIRVFRFSLDGQYLLAQDDSSIFVLSRQPLANLFRIDAPDALAALFSPDSRYIVLYSRELRVERWNIVEQRLEDVRELYVYRGCVRSAISPDGNYLACIRPDRDTFFPLDFVLYNLNTEAAVLTKKGFIGPLQLGYTTFLNFLMVQSNLGRLAAIAFSPDARYLLVGRDERHLMVDLKSESEIDMPGALRKVTSFSFAFVGPDQVVGAESSDLQRASMVKVPSGETVTSGIPIGGRTLYPVTKGPYVIVRPMTDAPLGIMDLDAKRIFRASRTDATDLFQDVVVSERTNGEVALYHTKEGKPFTTTNLPTAPLGRLAAAAVAPHASAIAVSEIARGAIWDLQSGKQLAHVRGFHGAFFSEDGLYLDFAPLDRFAEIPSQGETEKDVRQREARKPGDVLARADFTTNSIVQIVAMQKHAQVRQFDSVLLSWSPADDEHPGRDVTLEARDAHNGNVIWSRFYAAGFPRIDGDGQSDMAVFYWDLGTKGAKEELKDDAEAKRMVDSLKETEGSYLVEVTDVRSGACLGKFPVETGHASFRATKFLAARSMLAMIDNHNRVLLYSHKGQRKGRLFGGEAAVSRDGRLLCLEREPGRLVLYDVDRLSQIDEMTFASGVVYAGFTDNSQYLVVLTADQTVFVLSPPHTTTD